MHCNGKGDGKGEDREEVKGSRGKREARDMLEKRAIEVIVGMSGIGSKATVLECPRLSRNSTTEMCPALLFVLEPV